MPDDIFHRLLTSFAGVSATQVWADYVLWELVLNEHPDLISIVEIGTFKGGFSRYLWAQAAMRQMRFATFDNVQPEDEPPGFVLCDVFDDPERVVRTIYGPAPVALFCDGGDKPREMRTFAPHLLPGSIVVVHDWLVEVIPADVPPGLREVHGALCSELGSMSRVFEVGS